MPAPEIYLLPFKAARPDAYAELLGTNTAGMMNFDDHLAELQMHLREVAPLAVPRDQPELVGVQSWEDAAKEIRDLVGPHFFLTERAHKMLNNNPYPMPQRMLSFAAKLAKIAEDFRQSSGNLGGRLSDYAMEQYGIEIALFDSSLNSPSISLDGITLDTTPHVKVDDAKSPDKCGRIYFAIDKINLRIVVDHIGLHNYA
ncbi:hypothetical protein GCM10010168_83990 [Actinoplanes ianthinogenes]|uniref:Uncharacterized protein n=1 Tax=Actinoplanes ianthinogenes TaxID=122358 RepID=A0ABN6CJQ4_9ACTN|nr:hypothetical protein Aiant_56840 [Actinoplanes ianthinogenes]GGR52331.1 hypothetical protein GCM10010168_83990 [Actinoplanes ianthinogenes]